ncbi:hypothetical protein N7517_001833 [Penicillium concentricum]|uniref:Uncharacterized protein n=1 Tax=Penicillium concentricum TaxID=293559 RepID=A0A9W9VJ82_9EURO|nr:uncharacterized protein N7517_001833 [Penicillium concentricum]KAJ5383922.1 hypothetical protein N7517_001833 [Penicillium concentricum]
MATALGLEFRIGKKDAAAKFGIEAALHQAIPPEDRLNPNPILIGDDDGSSWQTAADQQHAAEQGEPGEGDMANEQQLEALDKDSADQTDNCCFHLSNFHRRNAQWTLPFEDLRGASNRECQRLGQEKREAESPDDGFGAAASCAPWNGSWTTAA